MKPKLLIWGCLFWGSFLGLFAQAEIPEVQYDQGHIIGTLPYGRHFFIVGNARLDENAMARKVQVDIWQTGRQKVLGMRKIRNKSYTQEELKVIMSNPNFKIASSSWDAGKARDPQNFRLYINKPLQFRTQYLLKFTFFERVELDEEARQDVVDAIRLKTFETFEREGILAASGVRQIILNEVDLALNGLYAETEAVQSGQGNSLEQRKLSQAEIAQKLGLTEEFLQNAEKAFSTMSAQQKRIELNQKSLAQFQEELAEVEEAEEKAFIKEEIAEFEASINASRLKIAEQEDRLNGLFNLLKVRLKVVYTTLTLTDSDELTVTELQTINIGSTFGAGLVVLDPQGERDARAYTSIALKFYFMPVDKRIAEPYLANWPLLNRLSFTVGIATGRSIEYKGTELEKITGVYPLAGLGVDLNRYFSLNAGVMIFNQPSVSPLNESSRLRMAPTISLDFDMDLFNRVSTLVSGNKYKIPPAGSGQ
ncbi:MAG: hypothetical protein AAGI38_07645 [Bacteroidota bacterium]